ncbi:unnamed protein product, partial [Prorocentrum cordatum]
SYTNSSKRRPEASLQKAAVKAKNEEIAMQKVQMQKQATELNDLKEKMRSSRDVFRRMKAAETTQQETIAAKTRELETAKRILEQERKAKQVEQTQLKATEKKVTRLYDEVARESANLTEQKEANRRALESEEQLKVLIATRERDLAELQDSFHAIVDNKNLLERRLEEMQKLLASQQDEAAEARAQAALATKGEEEAKRELMFLRDLQDGSQPSTACPNSASASGSICPSLDDATFDAVFGDAPASAPSGLSPSLGPDATPGGPATEDGADEEEPGADPAPAAIAQEVAEGPAAAPDRDEPPLKKGKVAARWEKLDKAWDEFDQEVASKKIDYDASGAPIKWHIQCKRCLLWHACKARDPKEHLNHLKACKFPASTGSSQLAAFPGWIRTQKPPVARGEIGDAPPGDVVPQPIAAYPCSGVCAHGVVAKLTCLTDLELEFAAAVTQRPTARHPKLELAFLAFDTYVKFDKQASTACIMRNVELPTAPTDVPRLSRLADCKPVSRERRDKPRDGDATYASQLWEPYKYTCMACQTLEADVIQKMNNKMKNILRARVVLEYVTLVRSAHAAVLSKLKFMSEKNCPGLVGSALDRLKPVAAAREAFLKFQSEDGGAIGADVSQSDLAMLRQAKHLLITNTGTFREKAIKGAFKGYVSYLFRTQVLQHDADRAKHGNRFEGGWQNYEMAEYLMSSSKQAFTRANLLEGAAPSQSTLKALLQKSERSSGKAVTNYLDHSKPSLDSIADMVFGSMRQEGSEAAILVCDEIVVLRAVVWDLALKSYVGYAKNGKFLLSAEEYKTMQFKQDDLARLVKFTAVLPLGTGGIRVLSMRPGKATGADEMAFNAVNLQHAKEAAQRHGVTLLGGCNDGIAKEKEWWRQHLLRRLAAAEAGGFLVGLDVKHQSKCGRGSMSSGRTASPSGGWLVSSIRTFLLVGVRMDCVRVVDVFSDFRVQMLYRALPQFSALLGSGVPVAEILGTSLYTHAIMWIEVGVLSQVGTFSRRDRIRLVISGTILATSFHNARTTNINFVGEGLPASLVMCSELMKRPHRWGSMYLEYLFSLYRCRTPSDNLTLLMLRQLARRTQKLQEVCCASGFKMGAMSRTDAHLSYGEALSTKSGDYLADPGVTDDEYMGLFHEAVAAIRPVLLRLGWAEAEMSPLCREFGSMRELGSSDATAPPLSRAAPAQALDWRTAPPPPRQGGARAPAQHLAQARLGPSAAHCHSAPRKTVETMTATKKDDDWTHIHEHCKITDDPEGFEALSAQEQRLRVAASTLQAAADDLVEPAEERIEKTLSVDSASAQADSRGGQGNGVVGELGAGSGGEDEESDYCVAYEPGSGLFPLIHSMRNLRPDSMVHCLSELAARCNVLLTTDKHKGMANKRTIKERLAQSSKKFETERGSWGYVNLVFLPKEDGGTFARIVAPFKKEYKSFLLMEEPDNEAAKLRELKKLSDTSTRFHVELATVSTARSNGGSTCWEPCKASSARPRARSVFAADAYVLPGVQFFPVAFPTKPEADPTFFHVHANVAEYLAAEVQEGKIDEDVDSRRVGSILKAIGILAGYAKQVDMTTVKASRLGVPLKKLKDVRQPQIAKAVKDLVCMYP